MKIEPRDLPPTRIASLDQFRGYTVLGMFLVNFVGSFAVVAQRFPTLKHHHTYLSYADTIMPQFFLAVGFAYRMTFLRRVQTVGKAAAYWHAVKRCLGLLLVAFVIHHLDGEYKTWDDLRQHGWRVVSAAFQRNFFQTLAHIAVTSLWIMPVLAAGPVWRVAWAVGSAGLFYGLSEWGGYYEWVMRRPGIDGGPLGFLTWTIPMVVGTLAYDAMAGYLRAREQAGGAGAGGGGVRRPVGKMLAGAAVLMAVGYGLSCLNRVTPPNRPPGGGGGAAGLLVEPPFAPPGRPVNVWTMSQRAGSVTYLTFGAGFALAVYALFVAACDAGPLRVGLFRTLGVNALAAYILHDLVGYAIDPFAPRDSPLWYVAAMLAVFVGINYLILRYLEKHRLFLKL